MTVHSGKFGAIGSKSAIQNWTINDTSVLPTNVTSGSKFGRIRNPGVRSWNGSFNQLLAEPGALPGDAISFQGFTAPTTDVGGAAGITYAGNIVISQATINWDWTSGAHINSQLSFVGDGQLTSSSTAVTDATVPDPKEVCGTKIEYSTNGSAWTELANCASATLTLSCDVQAYVNSSTGCWTGQRSGPLDWNASITVQDNIRTGPAIGSDYYWRFYVDGTLFWLMKWGTVREYSNINVNVETGAIISHTIGIDMNGAVGGVLGQVRSPALVAWFN